MERWARRHDRCGNCGTTRRPHKARGYCSTCYRLIRRLEQVEAWDLEKPVTLKGYPDFPTARRAQEFPRLKAGFCREIRKRLDQLHLWEDKLSGPIEGIDLEHQLHRIARLSGARRDYLFNGLASYLQHAFNPEQRQALFRLLFKIEEEIPWPGVQLGRLYEDMRGGS